MKPSLHNSAREANMGEGAHLPLRSGCAVAVMAKASMAGRTKTRLVPPLTPGEAAMLNTVFLRDAADNILSAATLGKISGWMAYAPAGSEPFFKAHLPHAIGLIETVAPTLGECLLQSAAALLGAGHEAVCLINSDSPTLPVSYLVTAATLLDQPGDRIVLGPSIDGGYYLIGMKRPHPGLFEGIAWSTEQVLAQTLARTETLGLAVEELPTWYDVDDAASLQTLINEVVDGKPFREVGSPTRATWTREYVRSLIQDRELRERIAVSSARGALIR